jgi:hypothetical protein
MTTHYSMSRLALIFGLAMASWFLVPSVARAADAKLEAVLVWGTNGGKPADSDLKPITDSIAQKLNSLPLKYTNYFEVNRKKFELKDKGAAEVTMSKDCKINVRSMEGGKLEVTLIGQGKPVGKITQELKKGHCLVTGGNAEDSTAWFVVINQAE